MAHKRTGLRRPKNCLKVWSAKDWTRRLTPRLAVGMVDEDLPFGKEGGRKFWYLLLTQDPDLLTTLGPVRGTPKKGKKLLLFEDDVVALCQHLALSGLIAVDDDGLPVNGPAVGWEDLPAKKRARRKTKR